MQLEKAMKELFKLPDNVYRVLIALVLYVLPASGTLYFTLASLWHLPYADAVLGTFIAIETFLGAVLGISRRNYEEHLDGTLEITHDNDAGEDTLRYRMPNDVVERNDGDIIKMVVRK